MHYLGKFILAALCKNARVVTRVIVYPIAGIVNSTLVLLTSSPNQDHGAEGGSRTHTLLRELPSEDSESANSSTPA